MLVAMTGTFEAGSVDEIVEEPAVVRLAAGGFALVLVA